MRTHIIGSKKRELVVLFFQNLRNKITTIEDFTKNWFKLPIYKLNFKTTFSLLFVFISLYIYYIYLTEFNHQTSMYHIYISLWFYLLQYIFCFWFSCFLFLFSDSHFLSFCISLFLFSLSLCISVSGSIFIFLSFYSYLIFL